MSPTDAYRAALVDLRDSPKGSTRAIRAHQKALDALRALHPRWKRWEWHDALHRDLDTLIHSPES